MEKKKLGDRYIIKPRPAEIITALIAVAVFWWLLDIGYEPHLPQHGVSVFHVILFLVLLLAACRYYVLDTRGITVMFFGIPLKKLSWCQIDQIILIRKRVPPFHGNSEGTLLIIPLSCAPFRIGEDKAHTYSSKYPFDVCSISVPPDKAEEYAAAFQKYYKYLIDLEEHS